MVEPGAILPFSQEAIARAAALIVSGEVVAYPTETRYGLAANALDPAAVARVVAIKGRHENAPFGVIVADLAMVELVARPLVGRAKALAEAHWPGPLTLVVPAVNGLPGPLLNEQGEVGARVSPDPVASALVRAAGCPLTATSANRSGEDAAMTAEAAALPGVALTLDDGLRDGETSTVVRVSGSQVVVLRAGAVPLD